VDDAVVCFLAEVDSQYRPMFDRVDRLVREGFPEAVLGLSYGMPTYRVGHHRLHVGVWKHGLSLYGWAKDQAAQVLARHPHLRTSTGTIRLRPQDAQVIEDDELRLLITAALGTK
jgi:uncharacterized protein YdhG (YjbR/CyaY superfamily)